MNGELVEAVDGLDDIHGLPSMLQVDVMMRC